MSSFFLVTKGEGITYKKQDSDGRDKETEGITKGVREGTPPLGELDTNIKHSIRLSSTPLLSFPQPLDLTLRT